MVADMFMQDEIIFKEKTHQYFNKEDIEYSSVSKLLRSIQVPFDRDNVSLMMAKSSAAESGISVEQAQKDILEEWDKAKDSSLGKGDYVHDGLEQYALTGKYEEDLRESAHFMQNIFKQYYRFYPEVMLYSHKYRTAGRTDLILQRQKNNPPVLDFMDYKTNESKGIQYDSISRKAEIKHYNRFLLHPFEYLEACNYNLYSLQLSVYAFMAMDTLGVRIGKLAIIFFDNSFIPTYIPVPFMYHEAELLCRTNITKKELPDINTTVKRSEEQLRAMYPLKEKEAFKLTDDWD